LQLPVNQAKSAKVATHQSGGQMSFYRDIPPGQNPHVNYEPSLHDGLVEAARETPNNPPDARPVSHADGRPGLGQLGACGLPAEPENLPVRYSKLFRPSP
jgi:catalase